jgi:hypothetical protein
MAALLATDWGATRSQSPDLYTDPRWWRELPQIERPWALALALVHGDNRAMKNCSPPVRAGITLGLTALQKQLANEQPPWLYRVEASFEKPLLSVPIDSSDSAAVLLAWAGPITMNP